MNASAHQLLTKVLKDNGYSTTAARKVVCELLWNREPQSMGELTKRCAGHIDRASLYRTVALFEQLGLVQRIYIGWKYKIELSDIFSHHHHHISCTHCGKVVAITDETVIEQLIAELSAKHHFLPESHQLEIRGMCPACQTKRPAQNGV